MLLNLTTDSLRLLRDQAGDIDVVVDFIERDNTTGAIGAAQSQRANFTTADVAPILAAPASGLTRLVQHICIRNAHATTSNDVTIQFDALGTIYDIYAARLLAGEMLQWDEHKGFKILLAPGTDVPFKSARIHDDNQNDSSTTTVNGASDSDITVPSLLARIPPSTNPRIFGMFGFAITNSAIATTACRTNFYCSFVTLNISIISAIGNVVNSDTAATMYGGSASFTTILAKGTDVLAAGMGMTILAGCAAQNGDAAAQLYNTLGLRYDSEVAASQASVHAGSWVEVFQFNP